MRLVHVTTGLGNGGAERALFALATTLEERGWSNVVISLGPRGTYGDRFERAGIPVWTLSVRRPPGTWARLLQVGTLVRRLRPNLVQGWMYHGNLIAALARRAVGPSVPLVWNIRHSLDDLAGERWLTALVIRGGSLFRSVDYVVYNSTSAERQHAGLGYRAPSRVIHNGISVGSESMASRDEARRRFGLPVSGMLIGVVGRHHPVKDPELFVRAAATVAARRDDVGFVAVGRGWSVTNAELMAQLTRAGLERRTYLLGEIGDAKQVLPGLDILTLTSRSEGSPNALGEGMAAGLACVATAVGGVPELVGEAGVLVRAGDAEGLAGELLRLLADERRRTELGQLARIRIARRFSTGAMVARYESLYQELLGHAPE